MTPDQIVEVLIDQDVVVQDVVVQEPVLQDPRAKDSLAKDPAVNDSILKVTGVMTKIWDYQPGAKNAAAWKDHAAWLVRAIAERRPRAEMDWYMSRVQLRLGMGESMAFRKIVDRSIELLADKPSAAEADRIEKLNPTAA
ncbi:MAG: hypothetical protein AB7V13_25720 [Pseudorhodoplanes sp.]